MHSGSGATSVHPRKIRLQFIGDAFNLFNYTNISTVNTTDLHSSTPGPVVREFPAELQLRREPTVVSFPAPTFMSPTSATSTNGLYGARQLQVSAKLFF